MYTHYIILLIRIFIEWMLMICSKYLITKNNLIVNYNIEKYVGNVQLN